MKDPERLVQRKDDKLLRAVLLAGRTERPSRAAVKRASVAMGLAAATSSLAPAVAAGPALRLWMLGKWVGLLSVGLGVAVGTEHFVAPLLPGAAPPLSVPVAPAPRGPLAAGHAIAPLPPAPAEAPAASAPALPLAEAPPLVLFPGEPLARQEPPAASLPAGDLASGHADPGIPARGADAVAAAPRAAQAPSGATLGGRSTKSTAETPPPAPVAGPAEPPSAAATAPGAGEGAGVAPPRSSLSAEVSALDETRRQLSAGHAARALELLDQAQRDFPRGVLQQEALLIRLEALLQQGRRPEAAGLGERFIAANPRSPLVRRVRSLLGREGTSGRGE